MTDKEQIWRRIAEMETPGFFITADIMCEGSSELDGLEVFIKGKITQIQQGITGFFLYRKGKLNASLREKNFAHCRKKHAFPTVCGQHTRSVMRSIIRKNRARVAEHI